MPLKDAAARAAYQAEYRKKNREKINEKGRARWAADKERHRAYGKKYRDENRPTVLARKKWAYLGERDARAAAARVKKYGTCGAELYEKQKGLCAICGKDLPQQVSHQKHLDHCHKTGRVRGWLCINCNTGIGRLQDDPRLCRAAADYLTNGEIANV